MRTNANNSAPKLDFMNYSVGIWSLQNYNSHLKHH